MGKVRGFVNRDKIKSGYNYKKIFKKKFNKKFIPKMEKKVNKGVFKSVAAQVLNIDLVDKDYAIYERDICSISHVVPRRGGVPEAFTEGEEIQVPLFEIACHPSVRFNHVMRSKRILKKIPQKAAYAICNELDTNVIRALLFAVESRNDQLVDTQKPTLNNIKESLGYILRHGLKPRCMIINPASYEKLSDKSKKDIKKSGVKVLKQQE